MGENVNTRIKIVSATDPNWKSECETFVRQGMTVKVVNITADDQGVFFSGLGEKFAVCIAHGDGISYVSPSGTPSQTFRPSSEPDEKRGNRQRPKLVLIVEGDPNDASLMTRIFDSTESCNAFVCRNLSEALAYMAGAGVYSRRSKYPIPSAIICELAIGNESGFTLLESLKTLGFVNIPFYVLAGSQTHLDLALAKEAGAAGVFQKPHRFEDLRSMVLDLATKLCADKPQ